MNNYGMVNRTLNTNQHTAASGPAWSACVCAEDAARFMGWPSHFLAVLARVGHLKPLGKPARNSRKWYAMVELERLSRDPDWLDKAIRIVEKQTRDANLKKRGRPLIESPALN